MTRRCKAKRKNGGACKAAPLHGEDFCLAHSDRKTRESAGFVANNGKQGRPKNPRVVDVMRERVEAEIDKILAPYFQALEEANLHAAYEGEVLVSDHPDLGARIAAAERLLDRIYGKPKQLSEVSGPEGGRVQIEVIGDAILGDRKAREAAHELRRRVASARAVESRRTRLSH